MRRCHNPFSFLPPWVHPRRWFFLLAGCMLIILPTSGEPGLKDVQMPFELGEIVYSSNEASPRQLYIIGISHRDTLTGGSPQTPGVEAEIYGIGEWLAKHRGVRLILPEGFFSDEAGYPSADPVISGVTTVRKDGFVPAEKLLKRDFDLLLRQVEDGKLYRNVYQGIQQLSACKDSLEERYLIRCDLDYHQQRRVGAMLQRIPGILEQEYRLGSIREKKGLFTIGLSHLSAMIGHFSKGRIVIPAPLFTSIKVHPVKEELNLTREGYGITVIVPRTLARDQALLEKTGLKEVERKKKGEG